MRSFSAGVTRFSKDAEHLSVALKRDHDVVVDRQGLVHVRAPGTSG